MIYVDFEFNGFKGQPLSIGLVNSEGQALYNVFPYRSAAPVDKWVERNVVPHLYSGTPNGIWPLQLDVPQFQPVLQEYLQKEDGEVRIVTDWPDDVKYFSELLITGPGTMINIFEIFFQVRRVDAYTNVRPLLNSIQHHALWDALQLRYCLTGNSDYQAFRPS